MLLITKPNLKGKRPYSRHFSQYHHVRFPQSPVYHSTVSFACCTKRTASAACQEFGPIDFQKS